MSHFRQAGLTLLEILVATALFSIVAGAGYAALERGLSLNTRLGGERTRWQALDSLMTLLERDLAGVVAIGDRGAVTLEQSSFFGSGGNVRSRSGDVLRFTRRVTPGLLRDGATSPLHRITWSWHDGVLERASWARPEQPPGAAGDSWPVLDGIDELHLRFLGGDGNWSTRWGEPGTTAMEPLPRAIEISIWTGGRGPFRRVLLVGAPR
jgi:type II secretion system protein J